MGYYIDNLFPITNGFVLKRGGQELVNVSHATGATTVAGAEATGDDLILKANTNNAYCYINIKGNSNLAYFAKTYHDFFKESTKVVTIGDDGYIQMLETTTPTAIANYGAIYTKNDNKLYFQDGAGVEHEIAFV